MKIVCIVVASHSLARFLRYDAETGEIFPLFTMHRPDGDEHDRRADDRARLAPRDDDRRQLHDSFARDIALSLRLRLSAGAYDSLWVVATDQFLGQLETALGDPTTARLGHAIVKDMTHLSVEQIKQRLPELIPSAFPDKGPELTSMKADEGPKKPPPPKRSAA